MEQIIKLKDQKKLEMLKGKYALDDIMDITNLKKQSAINLMSKLSKKGFVKKSGGGREKRIYTISLTQNVEKENGLFTIINRYSKLKVNPSFKHIVHGNYGCENALIDAIEQNDARALLASLSLFNHIKNWSKLYSLAKERKLRKIVGALYDVSREAIKTNKMPNKTYELMLNSDDIKQINFETKKEHFKEIKDRWNINIPFSEEDLKRIRG